jgi:hypothetical protein
MSDSLHRSPIPAYFAVGAVAVAFVAYFGVQPQGFHGAPRFYGWPMAEWFRVPFVYALFGLAVAAASCAAVSLINGKLKWLAAIAFVLSLGLLAHEWSALTNVVCHSFGATPYCLGGQ